MVLQAKEQGLHPIKELLILRWIMYLTFLRALSRCPAAAAGELDRKEGRRRRRMSLRAGASVALVLGLILCAGPRPAAAQALDPVSEALHRRIVAISTAQAGTYGLGRGLIVFYQQ